MDNNFMQAMTSENIDELAKSMCKAQLTVMGAKKDRKNHFKGSFADLTSVWDACREAICSNGLSVVQTMEIHGSTTVLITRLIHSSGQWIKGIIPLVLKPGDTMQAMGSSITYARRYGLAAIIGIVPDDDDDGTLCSQKSEDDEPQRTNIEPQKPELKISIHQIKVIDEILDKEPELKQRMIKAYGSIKEIPAKKFDSIWENLNKEIEKKNQVKDQVKDQVNIKQ